MKRALLLAGLGFLPAQESVPTLSSDDALDVTAEGLAFVQASAERRAVFVGEPLRLRVRFGFETGFLEQSLIQLFRRELDVPALLQAPWLEGSLGAGSAAGEHPERTFALERDVARAADLGEHDREGRSFLVLELERRLRPTVPGELVLDAPRLRFAYATGYREDVFHGRVPADRVDAFVVGEPLALEVRALPEEGRPPGFSGAVGRFAVEAAASPRELELGESLALTLRITGEGALDRLEPLRLDGLAGFHVRGVIAEPGEAAATFVYDLEPERAGPLEVPPVPFSFFDPGPPPAYRTIHTREIPLLVRARAGRAAADNQEPRATGGDRSGWTAFLAAAVAGILALVLVRQRRARGGSAESGAAERRKRRQGAAARFVSKLPGKEVELEHAFGAFLVELCEESATPGLLTDSRLLRRRLESSGVPPELAARAVALLERLAAPRYGGPRLADGAGAACDLAEEIAAGPRPGE